MNESIVKIKSFKFTIRGVNLDSLDLLDHSYKFHISLFITLNS
jgi:hypothetical protein